MHQMFARGWRGLALALCAAVMLVSPSSRPVEQTPPAAALAPVAPNFELASRWTSAKVGKLVFDTSVTPRWMQSGDRFWYTYQTRDGRRFYVVDPLKKAKAPLFDHAKVGAADRDHAAALRRAASAVLQPQVRAQRLGLRVRRPGPARRRHRHHQEKDHDDTAGGGRRGRSGQGRR